MEGPAGTPKKPMFLNPQDAMNMTVTLLNAPVRDCPGCGRVTV